MSAQSREITPEQLDFRNQIQQFLKEEGYVPSVDEEDNSLVWKKEGTAYWLYVEAGPDPFYIEIHKGGFDLENQKRFRVNRMKRDLRTVPFPAAFLLCLLWQD